mmetsp:Transcript_34144/g.88636  ORF Transcript_34144/g.88636 Transcript_34144/m.88636 type:complete len:240 (+) Transcript_34144:397-1116(+)
MDDTSTNLDTPACLAASTRCTVPTLSTAWACSPILKTLSPGTNPVAHTTASTEPMAAAKVSTGDVTSILTNCTPSASMPRSRALSKLRTPAKISTPPMDFKASTTSLPVAPVAPTTRTFFPAAWAPGTSAKTGDAAIRPVSARSSRLERVAGARGALLTPPSSAVRLRADVAVQRRVERGRTAIHGMRVLGARPAAVWHTPGVALAGRDRSAMVWVVERAGRRGRRDDAAALLQVARLQ